MPEFVCGIRAGWTGGLKIESHQATKQLSIIVTYRLVRASSEAGMLSILLTLRGFMWIERISQSCCLGTVHSKWVKSGGGPQQKLSQGPQTTIAHEGWPVQRFRHVESMLSEAGHSGRMKRHSGRRKMDHREKKIYRSTLSLMAPPHPLSLPVFL